MDGINFSMNLFVKGNSEKFSRVFIIYLKHLFIQVIEKNWLKNNQKIIFIIIIKIYSIFVSNRSFDVLNYIRG